MRKPVVQFVETVRKSAEKGGWTYMVWPASVSFFGTRARVKVKGQMDEEDFESSFMPLGDGTHKLPITGQMLKKLGKGVGDDIEVVIVARL